MPHKLCFILMPFKDDLKEVYDDAIKPACKDAGFESLRVDELEGMFNINRKIIENIFASDAIIADLTSWNPNVFYEMGVAHAIDNKTIMIIQKDQKLPFDVHAYRCIQYAQSTEGLKTLKAAIKKSLDLIDKWRKEACNPVQEFKPSAPLLIQRELEEVKQQLYEKELLLKSCIPKVDVETLQKQLIELKKRPTIEIVTDLNKEIDSLKSKLNERDHRIQVLLDEGDKKKTPQTKLITPPGMVLIPAGEFMMGTIDQEFEKYVKENKDYQKYLERERPVHKVYLDNFFIDQYPITNTQYAEFLNEWGKDTDESGQKMIEEYKWGVHKVKDRWEPQKGFEKHPVVYVTWFGANQFAKWAQKQLPAEAQWEKAARGGNGLEYATQTGTISHELANYDSKIGKTTPVGQYPPNPFNLFDMSGNVWEWCLDRFDEQYYQSCAKQSVTKNPTGPEKGKARVLRGGSWGNDPIFLRAADRDGCNPTYGSSDFGFRCSRA